MRELLFSVLMFCGLMGCVPCPPEIKQSEQQQISVNAKETVAKVDTELFTLVSRPIAIKYYDFKHKPIVRVFIGQLSSDIDDGGLAKSYLGYYLADSFKKATQFTFVDMLDDSVDCYIEGNVQTVNKDKFRVIFYTYDNKSGEKVAEVNKIYNYGQLDGERFAQFKEQYKVAAAAKEKIGNTRLMVAINASGKSLDSYETTYKSTYRSSSEYSGSAYGNYKDSDNYSAEVNVEGQARGSSEGEFATQEKTGRVGAYPSEIQVFLNGKYYKPNSYGVAYDQNIYPGKYDVVVSFRETYWDSARSSEIKGKKHEKKLQLNIVKDKVTMLNLTVTYDGKTARILPNVSME